ncbi:hypothetical protein L9F63_022607 [Diploptera punctata]|uniref:DUF7869 domain-containing protein n=1 Tax=Diploptera punctata TaxID=6984 RepID=A0AAD7ZMD9_DIPPU|nr:hypothetical protein L9F63_022607 [Diploptera punctata]
MIEGKSNSVRKECFRGTFGETTGFIERVAKKKRASPTGILPEHGRGKGTPQNKKSEDELQTVKNHILSFPTYESHYCRQRTTKKFLPQNLNISKMYELYRHCTASPVSLTIYTKCFHELNVAFRKPKQDTCHTCDLFNMKVTTFIGEEEVTKERDAHHKAAEEEAYSAKRHDKEDAKLDESKGIFVFDLQQCLPTPYLTTSVSFYKRQLWTFNLTIHDLKTNKATCFMWDETVSGRGGNQIASCLYQFISQLPQNIQSVVFYSDCCGGQNRNSFVASMFSYVVQTSDHIEEIHHKFLVSGHTHLECDTDHAIIEKEKKRTGMKINHPNDWYQLVRSCRRRNPFNVFVVEKQHFLDFSSLCKPTGPFQMKKTDTLGNTFLWQKTQWLKYVKETEGIIFVKESLNENIPFKEISLRRRGRNSLPTSLPVVNEGPIPISKEKKKDLLDLLPLIDSAFHDFYKNLPVDNVPASDPDLEEYDADA